MSVWESTRWISVHKLELIWHVGSPCPPPPPPKKKKRRNETLPEPRNYSAPHHSLELTKGERSLTLALRPTSQGRGQIDRTLSNIWTGPRATVWQCVHTLTLQALQSSSWSCSVDAAAVSNTEIWRPWGLYADAQFINSAELEPFFPFFFFSLSVCLSLPKVIHAKPLSFRNVCVCVCVWLLLI